VSDEQRFQEALQAVFGPRCAEFQPGLRDLLRQLYSAAHADGVHDAALTGCSALEPGTKVTEFLALRPGTFLQKNWLRKQGQVRRILSVTYRSVVLDAQTGKPVTQEEGYTEQSFRSYQPYTVVLPVESEDSAA